MAAPKKWQQFERVVAAIHEAESAGGTVTWNDTINGRQFDVTIRFRHGPYDYLTVVECKHESRRVEVGDIDAFVTKSGDARASKAVMVSAAGFQQGCVDVANRHGIGLFTLEETIQMPEELLSDELVTALNIHSIELFDDGGRVRRLSSDARPEDYLAHNIVIALDRSRERLSAIIERAIQQRQDPITTTDTTVTVECSTGTVAHFPHEDGTFPTKHVRFSARLVSARTFRGPACDPRAFALVTYSYQDTLGGGARQYPRDRLRIDYGTSFVAGRFYKQPKNGFAYFCQAIEGELATILLIESYQLGRMWQASFQQKIEYARLYIDVTDEAEIERLGRLLERYRRKQADPPAPS